jgi:hypothetical protein
MTIGDNVDPPKKLEKGFIEITHSHPCCDKKDQHQFYLDTLNVEIQTRETQIKILDERHKYLVRSVDIISDSLGKLEQQYKALWDLIPEEIESRFKELTLIKISDNNK